MSLVLVVASSHVNRLVVSRMVQAIGLKVSTSHPDGADAALERDAPCMVVVDNGAMGDECADLLRNVERRRRSSSQALPLVVGLGNHTQTPDEHAPDAIVSKPIIGEVLQAEISRLIGKACK